MHSLETIIREAEERAVRQLSEFELVATAVASFRSENPARNGLSLPEVPADDGGMYYPLASRLSQDPMIRGQASLEDDGTVAVTYRSSNRVVDATYVGLWPTEERAALVTSRQEVSYEQTHRLIISEVAHRVITGARPYMKQAIAKEEPLEPPTYCAHPDTILVEPTQRTSVTWKQESDDAIGGAERLYRVAIALGGVVSVSLLGTYLRVEDNRILESVRPEGAGRIEARLPSAITIPTSLPPIDNVSVMDGKLVARMRGYPPLDPAKPLQQQLVELVRNHPHDPELNDETRAMRRLGLIGIDVPPLSRSANAWLTNLVKWQDVTPKFVQDTSRAFVAQAPFDHEALGTHLANVMTAAIQEGEDPISSDPLEIIRHMRSLQAQPS